MNPQQKKLAELRKKYNDLNREKFSGHPAEEDKPRIEKELGETVQDIDELYHPERHLGWRDLYRPGTLKFQAAIAPFREAAKGDEEK